ncbi:MAG: phosphotransferase [Pseudomonadota bacterium]
MTDLTAQAVKACESWGGSLTPPRLIANRENAVFEVTLIGGIKAALRLHRPGYQSSSDIWAELHWTNALAAKGFPCPRPIMTEFQGMVVSDARGAVSSVVSWIDAAPIGKGGEPFNGPLQDQLALMERLGATIRRLHRLTDELNIGRLQRPSWDAEALLGENPHWGRFWENPSLSSGEAALLRKARAKAAQQLSTIKGLDTGLIHADLLQENILQNADGLHIIDFDDAGYGYRLYDLGTALVQHAEHPDRDQLAAALCRGYGCDAQLMPLFILLRTLASCGWVIPRLPRNDPGHRVYANRALRCATDFLSA